MTVATLPQDRGAAGADNGRLAMVCVLLAETMFFVGMVFVTLAIRRQNATWPPPGSPHLNPLLLVGNTAVLLISSLTMVMARRALVGSAQRVEPALPVHSTLHSKWLRWLVVSTILAFVFVAGQLAQFVNIGGWRPAESMYTTLFQVLAGFHIAHVLAGVALLAVVLYRGRLGLVTREHPLAITVSEWYWHFVTAVWLVLLSAVLGLG